MENSHRCASSYPWRLSTGFGHPIGTHYEWTHKSKRGAPNEADTKESRFVELDRHPFFFIIHDVRQISEKYLYETHLRSERNGKQNGVCHEAQGQPCWHSRWTVRRAKWIPSFLGGMAIWRSSTRTTKKSLPWFTFLFRVMLSTTRLRALSAVPRVG